MKKIITPVFILFFAFTSRALAEEPTLSFSNLILAAEKANHGLTAAEFEEKVTEARRNVSFGNYIPSVELDAADSWGYPGSSGSLGIPGIAGSPFRAGIGADALVSGTIWDFGRTSSLVRAADHVAEAAKADLEVKRSDVDHEAMELYFDCVRNESEKEVWSFVSKEAIQLDREVEHFVTTGQTSIVDKYLARTQAEQAETSLADFEKRAEISLKRLQLLTELPLERLSCGNINSIPSDLNKVLQAKPNPLLKREDETGKALFENLNQVKADYMPKLKAYAAEGLLEGSHILGKQDYAVGVGLSFPLFDGFKTVNGVKAAEAESQREDALIADTRYRISQANAKYDLMIEASTARLIHLQQQIQNVEKGFSVARQRYENMHGSLVDLREALRNLASVRSDLIETKTALISTSLEKEIFNGSQIKP